MATQTALSLEELGRIGERIYHEKIRPIVLPRHKGEFLVLDIDSGDYEVDKNDLEAEDRLRARRPKGTFFAILIGYRAAESLGGRLREEE